MKAAEAIALSTAAKMRNQVADESESKEYLDKIFAEIKKAANVAWRKTTYKFPLHMSEGAFRMIVTVLQNNGYKVEQSPKNRGFETSGYITANEITISW